MRGKFLTTLAVAAVSVAACASAPTVEVRYDPNNFNGYNVYQSAVNQCQAQGRPGQYKGAKPHRSETGTGAGFWRYKVYECTKDSKDPSSGNSQ